MKSETLEAPFYNCSKPKLLLAFITVSELQLSLGILDQTKPTFHTSST
jgi:hypothetical protein